MFLRLKKQKGLLVQFISETVTSQYPDGSALGGQKNTRPETLLAFFFEHDLPPLLSPSEPEISLA
jgi:hypothetical protein